MKVLKSITRRERGRISAVLLLLFVVLVGSIQAAVLPGDSNKTKYDISDPRNPDCPCHKHQEKAEKEYKRFLLQQAKQEKEVEIQDLDKKEREAEVQGTNEKDIKIKKTFHRRSRIFYFKANKKPHKNRKSKKIRWFRKDISKCFHW